MATLVSIYLDTLNRNLISAHIESTGRLYSLRFQIPVKMAGIGIDTVVNYSCQTSVSVWHPLVMVLGAGGRI